MGKNKQPVVNSLYNMSDKLSAAVQENADGQNPVVPSQKTTLDHALLRRYDDLLRTKRDLSARLIREIENLRAGEEAAQFRAKLRNEFEEFYKKVEETDCEFDPADQKRLADTCRIIENIRMEVIRIQARGIPAATTPVNESTVPEKKEYSMAELDSLTFSQLFRFGWALTMPLCIAVILAAILIGAAVILSFNGAFLW